MMTKYFTIYMCFISHGFSFCNWVTNFFKILFLIQLVGICTKLTVLTAFFEYNVFITE